MQSLIQYAARLPAHSLNALCMAIIAVVIAAGLLFIKAPWQALQSVSTERIQYEQSMQLADGLREAEAQLTAELAKLDSADNSRRQNGKADQRIVEVLGTFNALAGKHQVALYRVTPGVQRSVLMYEEIPLHVEVGGRYVDMAAWLLAVEQEVPMVAVTQFDMTRAQADSGAALVMKVNIALYAEREGQGPK